MVPEVRNCDYSRLVFASFGNEIRSQIVDFADKERAEVQIAKCLS